MEEDIKILENYLEQQDRKFVSEYRLNFLQAIEHLIARNKELEQNYINPSKARFTYFDNGKGTKVVIEGFISKEKVKEWLEQKRDYFDKELQKADSNKNEEIKERIWCASATLEELEQDLLED